MIRRVGGTFKVIRWAFMTGQIPTPTFTAILSTILIPLANGELQGEFMVRFLAGLVAIFLVDGKEH